MTKIEKAVQWAIQTANDNSHGYSQADRWSPDYDCSSFVISAWEAAGVHVRNAGASYTGNMRGAFLACGFFDATSLVNLGSGGGIQAGDVLLNYSAHTCLAIGGGRVANCRTDEGHPQSGDQSGNEIRLQGYWNYPWNCVLRYKEPTTAPTTPTTTQPANTATATLPVTQEAENHSWKPPMLKYDPSVYYEAVKLLQAALNVHNFDSGKADGYYGAKTTAAVNKARRFYGMDATGVCDSELWKKLGVMGS